MAGDKAGDKKALVLGLADDLAAESADLTATLSGLSPSDWDAPTPAEGWTIRDQVTHLAYFDDTSLLSLRDADAFRAQRDESLLLGDRFPDIVAERHRHLSGSGCMSWFSRSRTALVAEYQVTDAGVRLPWYGPDFSVPASITGRLMETWAHGQDIADTVGVSRVPTPRLRHVAEIGVRAFGFCFAQRGLAVPSTPVYVFLTGPAGAVLSRGDTPLSGGITPEPPDPEPPEVWTWGPVDAADRVTGDALDFCLVVTQRRNVADTGLRVEGEVASAWIAIAQAFAGRPTDPRPPAGPPPAKSAGSA